MSTTRRGFIQGTASIAAAAALPRIARADATFVRHDATSDDGKRMLASYAKGIAAMLKLPASDPRNWFRTAFTHFLDCPHGNWWFYVWHRGFVGHVEQTVRALSGDPAFAFPYWDWSAAPEVPAAMFDGVLTPTAAAFAPYTKDLDTFTAFIQPALRAYWDQLDAAQRTQLEGRGYGTFEAAWNDVTGLDAQTHKVVVGNEAFAENPRARYLTATNRKLDPASAEAASWATVSAGLEPTQFYSDEITTSFASSKTASHLIMPGAGTKFSILEGQPHNLIHNYLGGVGPWGEGPYGNMTNFLSPVDPIFFLHHANIDRLWDVWTRKQQQLGLAILPTGKDLAQLAGDPFRFFVRADGGFVLDGKAGDYFSTDKFGYRYAEPAKPQGAPLVASAKPAAPVKANAKGGVVSLALPSVEARPVIVAVTLTRPSEPGVRQLDVLVNAPAGAVAADSAAIAGTVGFFGPPMHGMAHDTTFVVPLRAKALAQLAQASTRNAGKPLELKIRLVPRAPTKAVVKPIDLKSASVRKL